MKINKNLITRSPITNQSGYSIAEILITAGILVIVIAGLIQLFIYTSDLSAMSKDMSAAITEAQAKMEEIRSSTYANITTDYASGGTPGNTFTPTLTTGKGIIYLDSTNTDLLQIEIMVSFQTRKGRIVGEDTDLDGVLDAGEDTNANSKLDSPVKIMSLLAER